MVFRKKKVAKVSKQPEMVASSVEEVGVDSGSVPVPRPPQEPVVEQRMPNPPLPNELPEFKEDKQVAQQDTEQKPQEQVVDPVIKDVLEAYKKYTTAYSPNDMANLPEVAKQAELYNLLFGIFGELKRMNDLIEAEAEKYENQG